MLIFGNETQKALCLHAKREYPLECCGILLGKREGERRIAHQVIPVANGSDETQRSTHFRIAPLDIARVELLAEREGLEIIGFYHSHPDYEAIVSREDALYMLAGYSYPIVSIRDGVCTRIACFEKSASAGIEAKEERIIIQGETSCRYRYIYQQHSEPLQIEKQGLK